jgi:anthranilate phosphoribosyltransferase
LNFGTATANKSSSAAAIAAMAAVELTASERAAVWNSFSARSLSQAELAAVAEIQLRRSTTRDSSASVYSSALKRGALLQGAGVRGDDVEAALALMADQVRCLLT